MSLYLFLQTAQFPRQLKALDPKIQLRYLQKKILESDVLQDDYRIFEELIIPLEKTHCLTQKAYKEEEQRVLWKK